MTDLINTERFKKVANYFQVFIDEYNDNYIKFGLHSNMNEKITFNIDVNTKDTFESLGLKIIDFGYKFNNMKFANEIIDETLADEESANEIIATWEEIKQRIVYFGYLLRSSNNNIIR